MDTKTDMYSEDIEKVGLVYMRRQRGRVSSKTPFRQHIALPTSGQADLLTLNAVGSEMTVPDYAPLLQYVSDSKNSRGCYTLV